MIAYEIATRSTKENSDATASGGKTRRVIPKKQSETIVTSTLVASIGAVVGLLIAAPPYSADAKWRSAIGSQDLQKIEQALTPGYLNPPNTYKYVNAVQLLEGSKLYDIALKYAQISVQFNPDSFDSWKVLYLVTNSSPEEKAIALENMKRLDPKNPNVLG